MNVHQFLTSYAYGDAIGNEALEIRDFLRRRRINSEIFALSYHPRYASQVRNYLEYDRYSSPDNTVIYHFSIASPVAKRFLRLGDKKVIIYHNITPYHHFLDFHRGLARECFKGRIELRSLADKVDLALGDSEFNRRELDETGYRKTGVLPLVIDFDKFKPAPLPVLKEIYADGKANLLYVGRIITHKKLEDVIKIFHLYQRYFNPRSRLFLVGEYRGFERYVAALQRLIQELRVQDVHLTGHIPFDEVVSYFKLSHLYLHMSEHEGFCAPVVESYHLGIPVVAFDAGAVAETMNNGGFLIQRKDHLGIAALIDRILTSPELQKRITAVQKKALRKYHQNRTGQILLDYLKQL